MSAPFISSFADVFPDARGATTHGTRIARADVELADGTRLALGEQVLRLLESLSDGVAAEKVAHLEFDEEFVAPERAAELLHVSRPTVYAWQDRGRLGKVERGSKRMVPLEDVRRLQQSPVRAAVLATAATFDPKGPDVELTDDDVRTLDGPDA